MATVQLTLEHLRTAGLTEVDPEIAGLLDRELERQRNEIELIASENFTWPSVMEAVGSVPTNKYSEGYPGRRYYGGCEVIDEIELLAIERAKALFGAEHANVQPHAGSQANMAVYFATLDPGDTILALELTHGGHLTHGHRVNFSGRLYKVVHYGVSSATNLVDYDQVRKLAKEHLPKLIAGLPEMTAIVEQVSRFEWEPIVGVYLAYAESVQLPFPMVGVANATGTTAAQWLFDRGRIYGQPGLLSAVISAHGRHEAMDHDALAAAIHAEVARILPGIAAPRWSRVITEKRATFACTPGMSRPPTSTPLPGLMLAGDYVAGDYPATIEGAVRSGVAAAHALLQPAA